MANSIYNSVAGNHPSLNKFDLSYTNTLSLDIGYLYPVQCDEVVPGDVLKMSCYAHAEVVPLVAPLMSDLQLFAHTFFVPYRLIYGVDTSDGKPIWEKFITGDVDGEYDTPLPAWVPDLTSLPDYAVNGFSSKLIWDYVGLPMHYDATSESTKWRPIIPSGISVSVAPKLAYNFVWNSFYRDENLQEEIDLTANEGLQLVSFKKDYFTSAFTEQQRGTAPALPVDISFDSTSQQYSVPVRFHMFGGNDPEYGVTQLNVSNSTTPYFAYTPLPVMPLNAASSNGSAVGTSGLAITASVATPVTGDYATVNSSGETLVGVNPTARQSENLRYSSNVGIYARVSPYQVGQYLVPTATTFNVSDLRLAFAIQRLLELNQTGGVRYTEFLASHYGVSPTDARLDRPEYIGGCMMPVSVSPSVQTSATSETSPQGNKAGIGHIDSVNKLGNYRVLEHGLIMTLISVRPKPIYKQGVNRQWLRQSRWDYYSPEFAYLSEQGIYEAELYTSGSSEYDPQLFGYQAHWNEMRSKLNLVSGAVREQYDYYVLARKFANRPHLNADFLQIKPDDFSHVFTVQDEDKIILSWSNLITAYRPIPAMGIPGLIDHVYGGR